MVWVENVPRVDAFEKEEVTGKAKADFVNALEVTLESNTKLKSSMTNFSHNTHNQPCTYTLSFSHYLEAG